MKQRSICALLLMLHAAAVPAQVLNGPESVEFHPRSGRHLVSNPSGGDVLWRTSSGTLSTFTAAPTAPYGIEFLRGTVFVLDSGFLRGYDVDTAASVLNLAITGASFLNGITSDGDHTLYITDFSAKRLHRVDVANLASPVQTLLQTLTPTPNGVIYDKANNRLLIATWGSGRVLSYDIATNTAPTTLITATGYSNIDGITLDCNGHLYIAAWSCPGGGGCLARFEPPFTATSPATIEAAALSNPADIDFDPRSGAIGIPESGANRVTLVQRCAPAVFVDDFER
ncbi:MAG: SMP-30/gluconolactonase/LRE family protein [Rhodanobacteraceae bacterium]|nr:SMP-30/gluconolactonase/LRE family protein [Rhodanobacteraceae bacterium]